MWMLKTLTTSTSYYKSTGRTESQASGVKTQSMGMNFAKPYASHIWQKALVERENVGFDLTKSDLCPSFVKVHTVKFLGIVGSISLSSSKERPSSQRGGVQEGKITILLFFTMSAKDSIRTQTLILTKEERSEFLSIYPVPSEYKVMLPTCSQTIFDAPNGTFTCICLDLTRLAVPNLLPMPLCANRMVADGLRRGRSKLAAEVDRSHFSLSGQRGVEEGLRHDFRFLLLFVQRPFTFGFLFNTAPIPVWSIFKFYTLPLCLRASMGIEEFKGRCWIAKSSITCDNRNENTMLSEAQGGVPTNHLLRKSKLEQGSAHKSVIVEVSHDLRRIPVLVYYDLYFGGKALVERENVGFDLTKSELCPSFIEEHTAKGVGLCMTDSHTGNHREDDFTPL
ncbi:hypothetical protein Tco_0331114 [Tanacetum coccineum]